MKYIFNTIPLLSIVLLISCNSGKPERIENGQDNASAHVVKVKEVIQATSYTYLFVADGKDEFWLAGPKTEVDAGSTIIFERFMVMNNFKSKDLDRTFDRLLFVEKIVDPEKQKSDAAEVTEAHGSITNIEVDHEIRVEVLEGGISLAELFKNADKYNGKIVTVSGEVVKVNPEIMNKNWVHIQDGSGDDENYDLTITTLENVSVGDILNFTGKITLNKDFGMGYSFDVLMEDASLVAN
ncbi:MAG: SH3-like domain-containing protein [Bacteroidetes bacterium]|nr:SH3-like domain-containing protein [Bacteroidota bacterium]